MTTQPATLYQTANNTTHNSDVNLPKVEPKRQSSKKDPKVAENTEEEEELDSDKDKKDVFEKDQFDMIKSLRKTIHKRYKIIEVIGKGSYGCVSKAKCKETGRLVALKVMKN